MKKSYLYFSLAFGIVAGFFVTSNLSGQQAADGQKMTSKPQTEKLLSINKTEARYDGIEFIPCHFKTALCPNKCGHSKNVAIFTITKYLDYQKLGEYGDDKQTVFFVDVSSKIAIGSQEDKIRQIIASLTKGQGVTLNWNHIYVTKDGNSYPERPVTLLEPMEKK